MNNIILKANGVREITRNEAISAITPNKTLSYSPISNNEIITTAMEQFEKEGLKIKREFYKTDKSKQKYVGGFVLSDGNSDMNMMMGWKNSMDKSMSAAYCSGANILICSNSAVRGEQSLIRRHTGEASKIVQLAIIEGVKRLGDNFRRMEKEFQRMKEIEVTKKITAELVGRLYLDDEIITAHQLSVIRQEMSIESFDYGVKDSMYNLYQAVTHSLKTSHPISWLNSHVETHNFFVNESGILVGSDSIEVPPVGSHPQLSLV